MVCYTTTSFLEIDLLTPVEIFLSSLTEKEIAKAIHTIELLQEFGNNLGMPHSRYLESGLLELRIHGKREIRIFYCFHQSKAVLLHACIKKTQKTLTKELAQAKRRKDDLQ